MQKNDDKNIHFHITRLFDKAGFKEPFEIFPIFHGGNNRAWMLKTKQRCFFLKKYFVSGYDRRDRFGTEISFSIFAWENKIRTIPEPIAADRANRLGLFSFVPGRRPVKEEIDESILEQALDFLRQLNLNKKSIRSQSLPCASEACFSIAEHIESFEKRLTRLTAINTEDDLGREAKKFIKHELNAKWRKIKSGIENKISKTGSDLKKKKDLDEIILSPSDFGFHNTILTDERTLFFVDFEYAGWDDPVKLICDFFSQPEIPVPIKYFDWFVEKISMTAGEKNDEKENLLWQAKLLFPLYRLKWCCIMLNDFNWIDRERKNFASFNMDKRRIQLDKAMHYFAMIPF